MRYLISSVFLALTACTGDAAETGCETDGEFQCTGQVLESCVDGKWAVDVDCDVEGGTCDADMGHCHMDEMTDMTGSM